MMENGAGFGCGIFPAELEGEPHDSLAQRIEPPVEREKYLCEPTKRDN